ncbi:MAG TPA: NADH-ubiquinone oxidoreductase-F iron-sulfur binding region domain-containing protein [Nocardioidaceae bacterium]|nr:NADH-ubiquinone oxidoreductase-F iron-sulfur binding region domain-containing protein [Nocardioidaceae bacterium]
MDAREHTRLHGPLPRYDRAALESLASSIGLLGRGGAAFPVATKLAGLPRGRTHAVVVNGSESEPASRKDRMLMRRAPHLVLDGLDLVAHALRARGLVIAVHDEASAQSLEHAILERAKPRARVVRTPARFVSGEARAVIEAVDRRPAVPTGRRTLPTLSGVRGRPTFLSNAETFAQLAVAARMGSRFADVGAREEPGTTLTTVFGPGRTPIVAETPTDALLGDVLGLVGAERSTVLVGGYHGTFCRDVDDLPLSRPALREHGVSLGAGALIALSSETCWLRELSAVADYLAAESSGQCGPCLFGLASIADDVRRINVGERAAVDRLRSRLGIVPGRGACAHPDGAARMIGSFLTAAPDEIALHLAHGTCGRPWRGELPLPGGMR